MISASFILIVKPYALPVVMGVIALIVCSVLVTATVRLIRRQIRLYNSIALVQLKNPKVHYWIFIIVSGFLMFYLMMQLFDPLAPEVEMLEKFFSMARWHSILTISFALVILVSVEFFLVVLAVSRAAVVDKGVYTGYSHINWYHVHDYLIDEDKGIVILTSSSDTFRTLSGTTAPLKVSKHDIPKLKFILNKNKNKFSGFTDNAINRLNQ